MPTKTPPPASQTELSASNPAVRVGMGAWQKPGEVIPGMAPGLSQHLPAGWAALGAQAHGYSQDTAWPWHQDVADIHGQRFSCCCLSVMANEVPRLQIPKGGSEFHSIPTAASPLSQPATAAPWAGSSPCPWVLGSWLTQPLDSAGFWGIPSSGLSALMLPEMFLSPSRVKSIHLPYFKPKGTYPSSPSP